MRKKIHAALKSLCITPNLSGHAYIATALTICTEQAGTKIAGRIAMMPLYEAVAQAHNTTAQRVEKAVRHAIASGFKQSEFDDTDMIFNPNSYKEQPTNSMFMAAMTQWLREGDQQ